MSATDRLLGAGVPVMARCCALLPPAGGRGRAAASRHGVASVF
jgi:hypothetical protein